MMGPRQVAQGVLFYEFSLDARVPADHLFRRIDRFVDLTGLRRDLAPFYNAIGRPSIDPELMIRMLLVGYVMGIRSERRLCEEVHLNLAYRWFCRLDLTDPIPDHPTFSKNRHGRCRGIGHATVKLFVAEGWRILTCSRQPSSEHCPWDAGPEDHIQVDLADPKNTIEAIGDIKRRLATNGAPGRLDALVNNAGILPKGPNGERLDTLATDLRTWGRIFHVNFFASAVLARSLLDELKAAQCAVVNVTSIDGAPVIRSRVWPMGRRKRHWPR